MLAHGVEPHLRPALLRDLQHGLVRVDRVVVMLTAGNVGTTQSVVSLLNTRA